MVALALRAPLAVAVKATRRASRAAAARRPVAVRAFKTDDAKEDAKAAVKEATSVAEEKLAKYLELAQTKWEESDNKIGIIAVGAGSLLALYFTNSVVSTIDRIPLFNTLFELVGLAVSAFFVYRLLSEPAERTNVTDSIKEFFNKARFLLHGRASREGRTPPSRRLPAAAPRGRAGCAAGRAPPRPHFHSMQQIEALIKCHEEHPIAKYFNACEKIAIELNKCFKAEKVAKRCGLARALLEFADVRVVATASARHFFSDGQLPPACRPALGDADDWRQWASVGDPVLHIELRRWADALVVAPLSANSLAKLAGGLCDNLLTCVVRAWDFSKPLLVAPAMNTYMWESPFTAEHLAACARLGVRVVPPIAKRLACGDTRIHRHAAMAALPRQRLAGARGLEASAVGLSCMSLVPGQGLYDPEGLTEEQAVAVPLEDTMRELERLVEEGKVRCLWLSEVSAANSGLLPTLCELGSGILACSPLGRDLLAGRFKSRADIPAAELAELQAAVPRGAVGGARYEGMHVLCPHWPPNMWHLGRPPHSRPLFALALACMHFAFPTAGAPQRLAKAAGLGQQQVAASAFVAGGAGMPAGTITKVDRESLYVSKPTWWLESRFHFSFAEYYDKNRSSFGALRVLNDDLVKGKAGFGQVSHPHRDAEIFSYVLDGELSHADSMGNCEALPRGCVQYMSAGTGIVHSEMNNGDKTCRFLQIWLSPDQPGHAPQYGSCRFEKADRHNRLLHLLGGTGPVPAWEGVNATGECIRLHQDANVFVSESDAGVEQQIVLGAQRQAYLVCIEGGLRVGGPQGAEAALAARDAAQLAAEGKPTHVSLTAGDDGAHFLLIEMAAKK
eukprot:scaffold4.g4817.t1